MQRNALSVAAASVLLAFLGVGFGLVQFINRGDATAESASHAPADPSSTAGPLLLSAAAIGPSLQVDGPLASSTSGLARAVRPIQAGAKVLDPNYTIAAGDTLVQIALKFNTTVARVQAFNDLSDPRTLRIGTRLVIPPPL